MNKTGTIILAIVIIILIALGIWYGVSKKPVSSPETKEPIKIGGIFALTGPLAGLGAQFKEGALFAIDEINSKGGINGKMVNLILEDNQSDAKTAVSAFSKLADVEGIKFFLSFGSAISLALKPLAEEKGVVLFADAAHPKLTENTRFTLRHSNIANSDAKVLVEEVKKKNPKNVGIIYINDDWGLVFNQELRRLLLDFNPTIQLTSESYLPTDTDFKTQLTKILVNKPNVVMIASFGQACGLIIKQLKELGYNGDIFVNIGFALTPDAQKIAGEAAKGIYYQTMESPISFESAYVQKYGKKPGLFAAYVFTDLEILKYAIERVGEDPEKVANFVKSLGSFKGTYEEVEITKEGDILINTVVKIWE